MIITIGKLRTQGQPGRWPA